jgi:hypothetical protein
MQCVIPAQACAAVHCNLLREWAEAVDLSFRKWQPGLVELLTQNQPNR